MYLIAGLGNQGDKYKNTRHNIGFMAVESIASYNQAGLFKSKFFGDWTSHNISGQKTGLLKTGQFMNESGKSVGAAAKFFKIPPGNIFIFHDELDLPGGKVKVKKGGGNAGHNGLKSVDAHLGTSEYWRIRLGIGHPRDHGGDKTQVSSYVLKDFSRQEQDWLVPLLDDIGRHTDKLLSGNCEEFVNSLNN